MLVERDEARRRDAKEERARERGQEVPAQAAHRARRFGHVESSNRAVYPNAVSREKKVVHGEVVHRLATPFSVNGFAVNEQFTDRSCRVN